MNSAQNQKLLVILLAGMAIGISSFGNGSEGRTGTREFASYEGDDTGENIAQAVDTAVASTQGPTGELPIIEKDDDKGTENVTANITNDNGKFTGTVKAVSSDDDYNDEGVQLPITAKNKEELKRRLHDVSQNALKKARAKRLKAVKQAKKDKEDEKRIANCEATRVEGSRKLKDFESDDTAGKLQCFKDRMGELSGKEKQAFITKVVTPFVKSLEASSFQALASNDPSGASYSMARNSLMQLQQTLGQYGLNAPFQAELNLGIQTANYRMYPSQQAQSLNFFETNAALALSNPNLTAAQRQALQANLKNTMNTMAVNNARADLGLRGNLMTLQAQAGSQDPMLNQAVAATAQSLGQSVQQQVAGNSSISGMFGGMINPSTTNTTMASILGNDPYGLNAIFGNPLASVYGANGINSWDPNSIWANNGNILAQNLNTTPIPSALNTPSFQPGIGPIGSRTAMALPR